ncbi:3-hydroxyisobutyrate dehydrogenase-like beta-hydroxyacid dehydrogenase [Geomicrobium halophilum]|uniref:3-hydroxyisobutyrate dehydrogenase-like beta-hydroxyacid dehydrogenase n=1 Tax=Geomicrobium halophilum TaxID=549000 RepID=A0A841PQL5_9BACL|nr:DUF1932 domain-containing protein [Geomicrobium halophilum]MBB6451039.1 3-hydroxyisobutyrate dehydrogenase-like beta-hydroxyacid dehydrogenase [Geomicrobium halophilum]
MNIGFIGFGEVGYEMSKGFNNQQNHKIYVYDPLFERKETIQRAKEAHTTLFDDPIKVAQKSLDVLFVAVPASYAVEAWETVWAHLNHKTFYVDLSTASAATKQQINTGMMEKGIRSFIDGAIMGPLKEGQHKVPTSVSGYKAEEFVHWGNDLDMNLTFVSTGVGDATNIKFIRSIFTKGLSTLLHEVMEIAELNQLEDTILESITETMDKEPFEKIMNRLITGNVLHAERRVKEMDNVIDFIKSHNQEPHMTNATRNKLIALANKNLNNQYNGEAPQDWKSVIRMINRT